MSLFWVRAQQALCARCVQDSVGARFCSWIMPSKRDTLPLQKMSENRVQLLTDLAQEFAAPTSHGAAFSDRKLDILRRLYQEFYR